MKFCLECGVPHSVKEFGKEPIRLPAVAASSNPIRSLPCPVRNPVVKGLRRVRFFLAVGGCAVLAVRLRGPCSGMLGRSSGRSIWLLLSPRNHSKSFSGGEDRTRRTRVAGNRSSNIRLNRAVTPLVVEGFLPSR